MLHGAVTDDPCARARIGGEWNPPRPEEGPMPRTFPTLFFALLCLCAALPAPVRAQQQAADDEIARARAVVADLMQIPGPDAVQETYPARIGGIDQWISIRGQDRANPVILFVHGGPATPTIPSLWQFQRPLEDYFTMVNYDQRGAGKTLLASDPEAIADTIHVQQFVADLIEVAEHVRGKLGKDRLVLMAHSW